ncbi:MAG: transposase [Mariprofundaceae bacterium]|nr:transposase [Mariprofundaceae bacterium]
MSKQRTYKTFTREFKLEAVRMMEASDRPSSEIAMELGIRRNQLYKNIRGQVLFRAFFIPSLINLLTVEWCKVACLAIPQYHAIAE